MTTTTTPITEPLPYPKNLPWRVCKNDHGDLDPTIKELNLGIATIGVYLCVSGEWAWNLSINGKLVERPKGFGVVPKTHVDPELEAMTVGMKHLAELLGGAVQAMASPAGPEAASSTQAPPASQASQAPPGKAWLIGAGSWSSKRVLAVATSEAVAAEKMRRLAAVGVREIWNSPEEVDLISTPDAPIESWGMWFEVEIDTDGNEIADDRYVYSSGVDRGPGYSYRSGDRFHGCGASPEEALKSARDELARAKAVEAGVADGGGGGDGGETEGGDGDCLPF